MKKTFLFPFLFLAVAAWAQDNIRLNQQGYFPNGQKIAAIIDSDDTGFEILRNGATVYEGQLSAGTYWDQSDETVKIADFSEVIDRGTYQLRLTSGEVSYTFRISDDAIRSVAVGSIKAYYYNRASMALESAYAGDFERPLGHADQEVIVLPSAATASRPAGTPISTPKGWYDAGDYNKYIVNSGISTYTLLAAYESYPEYYETLDLNIPESGNELPDVLDEALWNIEWMATMQDEDGGVYNKTTHANFQGAVMPHEVTATRYVVAKGTAATLDFAGVMAMAARVYKAFLPEQSEQWLQQAEDAWQWAQDNPNIAYNNPEAENGYPGVVTGGYGDGSFSDEFFWAACELAISTADASYFAAIDLSENFGLPAWPDVETLGLYSLHQHRKTIADQVDTASVKNKVMALADAYVNTAENSPYRIPNNAFYWGSNGLPGNQGMLLLKAYELTGNSRYYHAAQSALDYLLGRNATGYSFVTGFGDHTPMHIHHRQSEADEVEEPVPGFLAGGPNPHNTDDCGQSTYPTLTPAQCYVDDWCSYSTNEITINWNAPLVYLSGGLDYLYQQHFWTEGEEEVILHQGSVSSVTLFPNPSSGQVTLTGVTGEVTGRIFNLLGQEVLQFSTATVDIAHLRKGIYLLEALHDQQQIIRKLKVE